MPAWPEGGFSLGTKTDLDRLIYDRKPANAMEARFRWARLPHGYLLTQLVLPKGSRLWACRVEWPAGEFSRTRVASHAAERAESVVFCHGHLLFLCRQRVTVTKFYCGLAVRANWAFLLCTFLFACSQGAPPRSIDLLCWVLRRPLFETSCSHGAPGVTPPSSPRGSSSQRSPGIAIFIIVVIFAQTLIRLYFTAPVFSFLVILECYLFDLAAEWIVIQYSTKTITSLLYHGALTRTSVLYTWAYEYVLRFSRMSIYTVIIHIIMAPTESIGEDYWNHRTKQ